MPTLLVEMVTLEKSGTQEAARTFWNVVGLVVVVVVLLCIVLGVLGRLLEAWPVFLGVFLVVGLW